MKQHLFGFVGLSLAVALAAGCKSNPQSAIEGVPAAIKVSASHIVVNVADSQRVDAQVVDAQGTPLTMLPAATSANSSVADLSTINPYPVPENSFWVKGITFGSTMVFVSSGSIVDTISVQTYPKSTKVGNPPADTVLSGTPIAPYPIALDANGDSILAPADSFWYTVDHPARLAVDSATGAGLAKLDGAATITLHVAGGGTGLAPTIVIPDTTVPVTATPNSAVNLEYVTLNLPAGTPAPDANTQVVFSGFLGLLGRDTASIVSTSANQVEISVPADLATDSTYDVLVEGLGANDYTVMTRVTVTPPPTFAGTFSSTTIKPGEVITATKGATDPIFDADTKVTVNGVATFVDSVAADGSFLTFAVPALGVAGPVQVVFTQLAATQQARQATLTSATADNFDTHYPQELDVSTADTVSGNGRTYVVVQKTYPLDPLGFDGPSVIVNIKNPGAAAVNVHVVMNWMEFDPDGDIDMFACTGTCTVYPGDYQLDGFAGATTNHPEVDDFTVPAGATVHLVVAQYVPASAGGADLIQLSVTGYP